MISRWKEYDGQPFHRLSEIIMVDVCLLLSLSLRQPLEFLFIGGMGWAWRRFIFLLFNRQAQGWILQRRADFSSYFSINCSSRIHPTADFSFQIGQPDTPFPFFVVQGCVQGSAVSRKIGGRVKRIHGSFLMRLTLIDMTVFSLLFILTVNCRSACSFQSRSDILWFFS